MQDLDKFKNEMNLSGQNVYVGHRYVPKIFGEWDNANLYEPLSIVQYQGNSFTSRQYVPVGIEITNEEYWASTGNYNAQIEQYRQDVVNLGNDVTNLNDEIITTQNGVETLSSQLKKTEQNLTQRGVNILTPPEPFNAVVGDGVTDDTSALNELIQNFDNLIVPLGITIRVTDTIHLANRRKSLTGIATNSSSGDNLARILYDGELDRKKTVVLLGQNDVSALPTIDSSGIMLKNISIDGNNKTGFGVYGTFLTNETTVDGVITENTLEYGQYYARSWYANFKNLTSRNNWGKGIAFGMPLEFQDGEKVNWGISSPIEMNNTPIYNIRAHNNGRYYSETNQNVFNPTDTTHRRQGYGIGFGVGNGFNADTFTSENNGGVNLYVYTDSQPIKHLKGGYLEKPMMHSSFTENTKTNMIIEHLSSTGGAYTIENVFMGYDSGGIHFTGNKNRKVWLKNVHQPRFLSSLDGDSSLELFKTVLKENVYFGAGYHNMLEEVAKEVKIYGKVASTSYFNYKLPYLPSGNHGVYMKQSAESTAQPSVSIVLKNYITGGTTSRSIPTLNENWVLVGNFNGDFTELLRGGNSGDNEGDIDIKIVSHKTTTV